MDSNSVHMVNRGSHGAIVLEQWGEKGGKGTRRERVKRYTAGLWPASCPGGGTFTLSLEDTGSPYEEKGNKRVGVSAMLWLT